ncbi:MAG: hypothetical protein IPJ54_16805 [Saprospiraceae bacterium]|nr:hypothetical protein [Saprospiraceae bacterium]
MDGAGVCVEELHDIKEVTNNKVTVVSIPPINGKMYQKTAPYKDSLPQY